MYWQQPNGENTSNARDSYPPMEHVAVNSTGYSYGGHDQHGASNQQNSDPYSAAVFSGLQSNSFTGGQGYGQTGSAYAPYQWDNSHLTNSRVPTSACESNHTVSHTPILSKTVAREPSHSLSLEASDAHPNSTTENGVSSQVTPESSYSVDTFGSSANSAEHASASSAACKELPSEIHPLDVNFGRDEDDWVHTEVDREYQPVSDTISQTHSEPVHYLSSREASEVPESADVHTISGRQSDVQQPVVAQVAPLLKQEQPIARVEPVTHGNEQTNIQRVAPTRPTVPSEVQVELIEPAVIPTNAVDEIRPEETFVHEEIVAETIVENNQTPERTDEVDNGQSQIPQQNIFSPNTTELTTSGESPNFAPATSTPVQEQADLSFGTHVRRGSNASVRQNNSHINHLPTLPSEQREEIQSDQRSDITQSSVGFSRGTVQGSYHERYRGMKEKYLDSKPQVSRAITRLDQYRSETAQQKRINPLMEVPMNGRRSVVTVPVKGPNLINVSMESNAQFRDFNRTNMSSFTHADSSFEHRSESSRNHGYGEDFVNASRRQRHNRSRPVSRANPELDGNMSYNTAPVAQSSAYEMNPAMNHMYYGGSVGRSGRMSAVPYAADYRMQYYSRRPQSSFDPRAMERFQRHGGNISSYDAYRKNDEESESEESQSDEDENEDSEEDELRRYNKNATHLPAEFGYQPYTVPGHQVDPRRFVPYGQEEMFFFGLIRLNKSAVDVVFRTMPPPKEFYLLPPIAKAAYLYHASAYKKLYSSVNEFHNKFNREFYNYKCLGDDDNTALCKICKSMYDDVQQKMIVKRAEAYKASQRELFSDERGSIDGLSDRGSVYENDADRMSDIMSIDASQQAPKKFRVPHAFVTFGSGGRMVTVNNVTSGYSVEMTDVKTIVRDPATRRLLNSAQMFRGPLGVNTPKHSVRLYVQRQIDMIRNSDVAAENPRANDVIDVLLLWQLLEMVVQQEGRVTGPDIAGLLIAPGASLRLPSVVSERSGTPSVESSFTADSKKGAIAESRAYDRFAGFLLKGHVEEAIMSAMQNGLYTDAMILTRRMFPGDQLRLANIETRFLSTRSAVNPVMTLITVASNEPAPILTNPPVDDSGSWRNHAAIVLANLPTTFAMETVYRLGQELAKRNYDSAADFCLLAVCLLGNFNVFDPISSGDKDSVCRQHIALIHASLPDNERDSTLCRFGFTLSDLHATEIFDYGLKLAQRASPLDNSVEYQTCRAKYAKLLADYGGFCNDAYRYCSSVASSIWNYYHLFPVKELNDLADYADRLRMHAADDSSDTTWIENLRSMINLLSSSALQQREHLHEDQHSHYNTRPATVNEETNEARNIPQPVANDVSPNPLVGRSRSDSLAREAQRWHEDHQEPIQISPRAFHHSPSPVDLHGQSSSYVPEVQTIDHRENSAEAVFSGNSVPAYHHDQGQMTNVENTQPPMPESVFANQHDSYNNHTSSHVAPNTNRYFDESFNQCTTENSEPAPSSGFYNQPYPPSVVSEPAPIASLPPAASVPPPANTSASPSFQNFPSPASVKAADPQSSASSSNRGNKLNSEAKKGSDGLLSKWVRKIIPDSKAMILPDDSQKKIIWDATRNQWVGEGMEDTIQTAPPPPAMPTTEMNPPSTSMQTGGLRAARGSGGSRYFNPLNNANGGSAPPAPTLAAPSMPIPTSFGFIPQMPDDADAPFDPFSGEANPTIHGHHNTEGSK